MVELDLLKVNGCEGVLIEDVLICGGRIDMEVRMRAGGVHARKLYSESGRLWHAWVASS